MTIRFKKLLGACVFVLGASPFLSSSCKPMTSASGLKNIYTIDQNNPARRREALPNEVNWTIKASGCSGILLSPTLVLTANHCRLRSGTRLKSGWSVYTRGPVDLVVTEVLEANAALDYAIASVKFTHPMPSSQTFPPYIATKPEDIYSSQVAGEGDKAITIGFPDDKASEWIATYAEGQMKSISESRIYFNIGVINGNSGGAILKKENLMLAAIVVGGTKAHREAGWDTDSADDPSNWNYGTPAYVLYRESKILQEQFPGGKNKHLGDVFMPRSQLYLSMQATGSGARLKVSASTDVSSVILCPKDKFPCRLGESGVKSLDLEVIGSGRKFYMAKDELSEKDLELLSLVAVDKDGAMVGQRRVGLVAPGKDKP